jgi:hypothetical protein
MCVKLCLFQTLQCHCPKEQPLPEPPGTSPCKIIGLPVLTVGTLKLHNTIMLFYSELSSSSDDDVDAQWNPSGDVVFHAHGDTTFPGRGWIRATARHQHPDFPGWRLDNGPPARRAISGLAVMSPGRSQWASDHPNRFGAGQEAAAEMQRAAVVRQQKQTRP